MTQERRYIPKLFYLLHFSCEKNLKDSHLLILKSYSLSYYYYSIIMANANLVVDYFFDYLLMIISIVISFHQ